MDRVRGKKGFFVKKSVHEHRKKCDAALKAVHEKKATAKKQAAEANVSSLSSSGRRLVDIAMFAEEMWCPACKDALSLRFLEIEKQRGLSSVFFVRCHRCLAMYKVRSDSLLKQPDGKGYPLHSANCKAALACVDTGVGHETLNHILDTLNVPTISRPTMIRAQERVSEALTSTAQESRMKAILEERALSLEKAVLANATDVFPTESAPSTLQNAPAVKEGPSTDGVDEDHEEIVPLTLKYDCEWQKRGHGHAYDSHSGHGSVIGQYCNKILAYGTRSKYCAMCSRGHPPSNHLCQRDWTGSSKSMEPAIAVDILLKNKQFEQCGVRLATLVGDADSSTLAALRRESPHPISKILDKNHVIKSLSNSLWKLKMKHKFLTTGTINYLKKCFSYACAQNQGNVSATAAAIMNIARHTFGQHSECSEDWCRAKSDPNYVFKGLPNGKPFSCAAWKVDFEGLLAEKASKAEQLAPGGMTQQNESFNHMVATRAPKSRHYCGTSANFLRVSAAVASKNIGYVHMQEVFKKAHLSPSISEYRAKVKRARELKAKYRNTTGVKRRRLFLKMKNHHQEATSSRKEGVTYLSGVGTAMERAATAASVSSWLPPQTELSDVCATVLVDIETTGLHASASIVQLSAKYKEKQFNSYMLPKSPFSAMASYKTGLRLSDGTLLYRDTVMETAPEDEVAKLLLAWLQSCAAQVILAGHNIITFDAPRIVRWLRQCGFIPEFCAVVYGFTDTIPILKQGKLKKQEVLAEAYLKGPELTEILSSAHNAVTDCIVLDGLLHHFKITDEVIREKCVTSRAFFERMAMNRKKHDNLPSLQVLKSHISQHMIMRMAAHGVTIEELTREYSIHGRKGLEVSLGVHINGKPRVTRKAKILDKIEEFIKSSSLASSK